MKLSLLSIRVVFLDKIDLVVGVIMQTHLAANIFYCIGEACLIYSDFSGQDMFIFTSKPWRLRLEGVRRPAAFAIVCYCFCKYRTVSYSVSCAEPVADFMPSVLVSALPVKPADEQGQIL